MATYKEIRALFLKRFNIPKSRAINRAVRSFTMAEKIVFYFFTIVFVLTGLTLLWNVSAAYLVEVPVSGGTLVEGVVGNPRFINPVLAFSEADKNLTSLIYSGLVRLTPEGNIENDLIESLEISNDKRIYIATLREDARFHDGEPVTADDVIFTISKISDPIIKSPRRGNWDDIQTEKIDQRTVKFTLKHAYSPFIYNLTTGILPKHIWHNVTTDEFSFSQFNTLPVGSGPFEVKDVERNEGGIPDYYELVPFNDSSNKKPYIEKMIFRFYPSETTLIDAYNKGSVDAISGISPDNLEKLDGDYGVIRSPLPRIFAVFWNQNQSKVLADINVRRALDLATPKEEITEKIFKGYAIPIDGPIPAGIYEWSSERKNTESQEKRLEQARQILTKAGWVLNLETGVMEKKSKSENTTLTFSISTGDAPELKKVAGELQNAWKKLGAEVNILIYETGDLNQNVIRPRQFEGLLFGEVVGRDADVYPFWHSSQKNDPGLNITLYASSKVDKLLTEARSAESREEAEKNLKAFQEEILADEPAVFLYTPSFLYVVPTSLRSVVLGPLTAPQDRFLGVRNWYMETGKVWRMFLE